MVSRLRAARTAVVEVGAKTHAAAAGCQQLDMRGHVRVLQRQRNVEQEDAAVVRRVGRPRDDGAHVSRAGRVRTQRNAGAKVEGQAGAQGAQLASDAAGVLGRGTGVGIGTRTHWPLQQRKLQGSKRSLVLRHGAVHAIRG